MKRLKFMKPETDSPTAGTVDALEVLLDPIRSKIVFEIIFKGEVTAEKLVELTKKGEKFDQDTFGGCRFVPLVGEYGWKE